VNVLKDTLRERHGQKFERKCKGISGGNLDFRKSEKRGIGASGTRGPSRSSHRLNPPECL